MLEMKFYPPHPTHFYPPHPTHQDSTKIENKFLEQVIERSPFQGEKLQSEDDEKLYFRDLSWSFPCLWSFTNLYEVWSLGYRWNDLACFFDSIPFTLRPLILNALSLLEDNLKHRISLLKDAHTQYDAHYESESVMFEMQNECGFLEYHLNPDTGERRGVSVNCQLAWLWNMTRPVLLHKLANYDLDFFCPDADFLRLLVDDILHEFEDGERYFRMFASVDRMRRAVLVQWSVMRRYNAVGQCYMVSPDVNRYSATADRVFASRSPSAD